MKRVVKILAMVSIAVGALSLQACRVRTGVVIGDGHHHGGGWHRWCGYDRWGRYYCTRYSPGMDLMTADKQDDTTYSFTTNDERVASVSEKYGISHYAATYVVRAVLLADQNDMSGLADLGLTKKDMENVYEGKKLSPEKENFLSEKLMMTNADTEKLAEQIAAAVKADN